MRERRVATLPSHHTQCSCCLAVAARLQRALAAVLLSNAKLREQLVDQLGFAVTVSGLIRLLQLLRRWLPSCGLPSGCVDGCSFMRRGGTGATLCVHARPTPPRLHAMAAAGCAHVSGQLKGIHPLGQLPGPAAPAGTRAAATVSEWRVEFRLHGLQLMHTWRWLSGRPCWVCCHADSAAARPPALHRAPKLRAALARALRARHVPQLCFKHDSLTPQQQELDDIFARLDDEAEEEQAGAAAELGGNGAGRQDGGERR